MRKLIVKVKDNKMFIFVFLFGVAIGTVFGFLLSPVKSGISINVNKDNKYLNNSEETSDDFNEDLAMEMGELR